MPSELFLEPLRRLGVFAGLSDAQLIRVAEAGERVVFKPGEIIAPAGGSANGAHLIVGGDAVWEADGVSEPITTGSLIGETAMFAEFTYGATITASSLVKAIRFERSAIAGLMAEDPDLCRRLTEHIADRLRIFVRDMRTVATTLEDAMTTDDRSAEAA